MACMYAFTGALTSIAYVSKRDTTGAYIASAALNLPNRKGPAAPNRARASVQIVWIRAMSAFASSVRSRLAGGRHMFIPHWLRNAANPACISDEIARACARAAASEGQRWALGNFSAAYSRIASDSQ